MAGFCAALAALIWLFLIFFHGRFWQAGPILRRARAKAPLPPVSVVVPARDEAESIRRCTASLLAQDYAGAFRVVLTDDGSTDGTGALAQGLPDPDARLTVLDGQRRPSGWSGKLWAVQQGVLRVREDSPEDQGYILLTDADIEHDPGHVSTLVEKAEREKLDMVSEMVELNCTSAAEKALVPAFVFFFALLYPFARVNDPASRTAGAAGGTILIRRDALTRIGGIEALKSALIDDCTLAAHVKRTGGRIYLGHSCLARSIRPYPHPRDIWKMIARTAYVQLHYSPLLLLGTVLGMALVWIAPVFFALFSKGLPRRIGLAVCLISMGSYIPTLRRFRMSPLWAILLPVVAVFYTAATVSSAVNHHRGRGVQWKNRAYTEAGHD
ncbi:glycosyltransferase [Acetobacter fallax]|uniref:Glycosyltransferase n=1 Tax=Acetobacter fallax TaxID=1737473 RepID=A0ABX0K9W8_9PROT|nr:glycosyltransferase [Acetobacter fallax]NHO32562.1 glycosyltransferase [Acetobacter fallax]NHO36093.1 glycosyltransferase [Acetobacter fallax]